MDSLMGLPKVLPDSSRLMDCLSKAIKHLFENLSSFFSIRKIQLSISIIILDELN